MRLVPQKIEQNKCRALIPERPLYHPYFHPPFSCIFNRVNNDVSMEQASQDKAKDDDQAIEESAVASSAFLRFEAAVSARLNPTELSDHPIDSAVVPRRTVSFRMCWRSFDERTDNLSFASWVTSSSVPLKIRSMREN